MRHPGEERHQQQNVNQPHRHSPQLKVTKRRHGAAQRLQDIQQRRQHQPPAKVFGRGSRVSAREKSAPSSRR